MSALTEIIICNMALRRVGQSKPLTSVGDGTLAASAGSNDSEAYDLCVEIYPRARPQALTDYPWRFARKFATLTQTDDGTGEIWRNEWKSAYGYPADCLMPRRFIDDRYSVGFWFPYANPWHWPWPINNPWRFVVRRHDSATVILTDVPEANANLEYTEDLEDASAFPEPFGNALAWLVASELALPLSNDPQRHQKGLQMYSTFSQKASAHDSNAEIDRPEPDGSWIGSRWSY